VGAVESVCSLKTSATTSNGKKGKKVLDAYHMNLHRYISKQKGKGKQINKMHRSAFFSYFLDEQNSDPRDQGKIQ